MISRTFTERMGTWAGSVVVAVAVLLMVSGCSGGGQGVTPTSTSTSMSTSMPSVAPPVVAPGVGRVDMGTASFAVPIDAYGMSVQDMNIVQAAHAARFDLCFYCVVQKGYSVSVPSGETVAQLDYQASWTEEQELAAQIAVAQCSDDMNDTQQWVDIVAAYQMETIKQHEAELTAIKLNLDDLVAKATDVLTMYGVM